MLYLLLYKHFKNSLLKKKQFYINLNILKTCNDFNGMSKIHLKIIVYKGFHNSRERNPKLTNKIKKY